MFDIHENLPICHDLDGGKHRTSDVLLEEKVTFSSLLLKEEIQSGLTRCGYTYLSPIQKNALPVVLTGTSIIAHAKSGTGKTLVYVLTVLNSILERKQSNIQCLILSPTREIAKQIYDVFKNVGYYIKDLKVEYFIGGTPLDIDVLKCKECQIAIGAPGRIKHLIKLGEMKTESIQMLILDEVDALLCNKEFAIQELASYLPPEKQTIVCTATFSDSIKQLLTPISSTIQYITVSERKENEESDSVTSNILIGIKQYIAPVFCDSTSLDTIRKRNKLIEILRNFKYDQCFIFVNYVTIAKGLCNMLIGNDFSTLWVSSEQNQSTRISTLNKLKLNQCNILVTTDLAARGIDVHNVNLVINMGIPSPPDVYIHRMGRAGRYGSEGAVITILHEGQEMDQFCKLISSVSTDPVVLYILPNEINNDVHDQSLESIECIPDLNAPNNMNEYHFKRNNENQGQKINKRKSKKSKKRRKSKIDTSVSKNDSLNQEKDDFSSEEEPPSEDVVVDKEMEKLVEQYIATIKEEIHRDRVTIDENTLKSFFKSEDSIFSPVPFTDYFKTTFIPIRKENDDDDDVFVQPNDDETLLQYARFIKKKHAFLDEQKIPCSILQFLELIKQNEDLIDDHVSVNVRDSVKEILGKIRNLLNKDCRKPSVISKKSKPVKFELGVIEKNPLKRINIRADDEPRSLDTVNSIEQETSNWIISGVEHLAAKYSPKRSKNHISASVKNFTADPSNISDNAPFMVFKSTRVHSDMEHSDGKHDNDNTNSHPIKIDPLPSVSVRGHSLNRPLLSHSNGITCPNCQHTFTLSGTNMVPTLHPISAHIHADMERRIWRNHFNFINNHVRSLPFIFGNR